MSQNTVAKPRVLIAYSEIGVKLGRTRRVFEEALLRSLRCFYAAEGYTPRVRLIPGRVIVDAQSPDNALRLALISARVFGVRWAAAAYAVPNQIEQLERIVPSLVAQHLERVNSFAVRARRVEAYPYTSRDVERRVGAAILEAIPRLRVNLENPDVVVRIEVRSKNAYVYLDSWSFEGPGGLPYGVEGDAAVPLVKCSWEEFFAAWLVARRGARLVFYHRGCRDAIHDFIDRWVPCGDARLVESKDPLRDALAFAEKMRGLSVAPRLVHHRFLSPLEGAPPDIIEALAAIYERLTRAR